MLNPKKSENGYYVETGWATTNKNIDIPDSKTMWKIEGGNKLLPNSPIKLSWKNNNPKNLLLDHFLVIDLYLGH